MSKRVLHTDKEVRIAFDPYRIKILETFFIHKGTPMTSKQVADYLGEPPSKINYHIGQLESIDLLRLDHTENVNGIIAKYYINPWSLISLSKEEVSDHVRTSALEQITEANFNIYLKWYLDGVKQGKKQHEQNTDERAFQIGTTTFSIFIKDEEFNEIAERVLAILEPYRKENKDLNEYKVLMSSVKITDASKSK